MITNKNLFITSLFIFIAITVIRCGHDYIFADTKKTADDIPERIILEGHISAVSSVAFSPDGKTIVTRSLDKTARMWNMATGKELRKLEGHTENVYFAAFSPDGEKIVTASLDKTARIWDVATGKELRKLEGHTDAVYSAVFSLDGKKIITASKDKTARIWDVATGKELYKLERHSDAVKSAIFSPDGKKIVTLSKDKTARIWDATTGKELHKLEGHADNVVYSVPDGKTIVVECLDKTVRIWDVVTGKWLHKLEGHTDKVRAAVFSPDGKKIVTASLDKTARIWDVATGKESYKLKGHTSGIESAVFSPDGKTIVTASFDKTARMWDATTGEELLKLEGHTGQVNSAVFSPDGKKVFTVSVDKTARIWNWRKMQESLPPEEQAKKERIRERLREERAEKERKAKEEAGFVHLHNYIKESGFTENGLRNLVIYGTKNLQDKFQRADEFDRAVLKGQITYKQNEIKNQKYILRLPYTATNIKVHDYSSNVELIIPLPLFVNKIKNNDPDLLTTDGFQFFRNGTLLNNDIRVFTTEVGNYFANGRNYGTHSSFLKKDGTITSCSSNEVTQVLNNNGVIYWEETNYSILHILVSDETEKIKKLVRQNGNYEVRIKFTNLFWGRPKSHGWFEHSALNRERSTHNLRAIQNTAVVLKGIKEFEKQAERLKSQPVYFITELGNDVGERTMADIIEVQIVEK
jgi:WD40 repeat protein